jgi:lipoprotein-anchoring transpeptidase ErfK/SrfK
MNGSTTFDGSTDSTGTTDNTAQKLGRMAALTALLAALVLGLTACSTGGAKNQDSGSDAASGSLVAEAVGASVDVFSAAGAARPSETLGNRLPSGTPRSFLVLDDRGSWLRALLPDGPNGATGWLRRADVTLSSDEDSVDVSLSTRTITVKQSGRTVLTSPVGVGAPATPTPTGAFFITDLLQPPDPAGAYGPYAFGLSGHSQVLHSFAGGDGQIGIHGTNEPSSIGAAVTHGCIRLPDDVVTQLAQVLPLGTPVMVHA